MRVCKAPTIHKVATAHFLAVVMGVGLTALPLSSTQAQAVLEEIIVTATKRVENIQDVPISMSVMSQETMDSIRAGGKDIRFLSGKVPSLIVESDFGRIFPRFYIRGVGNTDFDQNASQPVSLIYDEVVYENPMLKGFPIFDVERIEVLRGPQGTLFGRNTPAGIVKIDSVKPSQDFDAYVKLGVGNLETTDFEAAIGGALNDNWSARASFLHQTRGDWVRNSGSDIDPSVAFLDEEDFLEGFTEWAYRLQLAYDSDDFTALFNVHGRDLDGTATLFRANIIVPGTNDFASFFDPDVVNFDGRNEQTAEAFGITVKLVWDFDNLTLTSVTGYETIETFSRADVEGGIGAIFLPVMGPGFIPFPAQTADGIPDHSQFTQELRLNNDASERLRWQAGVFYFDEHLEVDSFNYFDRSDAFDGFAHQDQDTTAWAIFGQLEYDMSDRMVLTAGIRYSDDSKDYSAERSVTPFGGTNFPLTFVSVSDDQVSGDLSLNYTVNDDVSIYGRYAHGFRAPSIQGRVLFSDAITTADSETIDSFEIGVKSQLMDNRLRLNAAIYVLEISDQQLTAGSGVANANVLINADSTKGSGVEVDAELAATENLMLSLGVSFNETEIDDPNLSVLPCGAGCTVLDPAGSFPGSVSLDGNDLPRAPEWMYNFVVRYNLPLSNGDMYFQTDWVYRSDFSMFLYDSVEFHADSFLEGGINVGYITDRWEVGVYGRNITDELKLIAAIDFNNLEGIINEQFTYGVEATFRF
ncbi:MAG: TonB-dependent receptor [Proteobacteria bacterium]|nr:TonB-dependent receptor [Pseudomonadota bacterium]MCH8100843.1 TonB-dependent receptor [Pseudomonadota bacterium]